MFTGIIEEIGTVKQVVRQGLSLKITFDAHRVLEDLSIDQSIAVNGVCLTVVEIGNQSFSVDAVPETLSKTTLINLKKNDPVNLERALRLQDRLGGHLVQGHVDAIGKINYVDFQPRASQWIIEIPEHLQRYTIEKGSIAIDGVSLTIAQKNRSLITIAIIPHTMQHTIFKYKKIGDFVNVEVDFFAKYIEQFLNNSSKTKLTVDWLKAQGF